MTKLTENPLVGTSRQRKIPAKFKPLKGKYIEVTVDKYGHLSIHPEEKTVIETWNGEEWVS